MELIKDYICLNNVMPNETRRNVFEYDCIVPDNMPDVVKILAIEGTSFVDNVRVENTFVVTDFTISYNILYMSDNEENPIKSFNVTTSHSYTGDISVLTRDILLHGTTTVENIEHTLINSRKLSLRTTVRVDIKITNNLEQGIATDISGVEGIQTLNHIATISTCTENIVSQCDISDNLELPGVKQPFDKLLRSDPSIGDISYNITGDKMQIRGNLTVCTLYIAEGSSQLQIIENQVPFTHMVDVQMREENQSRHIDYSIKNFNIDIIEDSDGVRRILNVNSSVVFNIKTYSSEEITILEDAYSVSCDLSVSKETIQTAGIIEELTGVFVLKDAINKDEDLPGIKEIVNVTCKTGTIEANCQDGAVSIQGFVICNVLYLTNDIDMPVASFSAKIPFDQLVEHRMATSDMQANVNIDVNHVSFGIISDSEIELRISLTARGVITSTVEIDIVTDCTQASTEDDIPCENYAPILLYIVQSGDSIWKIAKKYKTDPELLKKINRLPEPYIIYPGQKLLISK